MQNNGAMIRILSVSQEQHEKKERKCVEYVTQCMSIIKKKKKKNYVFIIFFIIMLNRDVSGIHTHEDTLK